MRLVIEKHTAADNNIKSVFRRAVMQSAKKEQIIDICMDYIPGLNFGYGSSHVWISNKENERLAIIYL